MDITFNNTLTESKHISKAAEQTYGLLRQLSTSQSFLPTQLRMLVTKAILVPTLFYGVQIFGHCDTQDMQKLTVACNSIVRYEFNLRRTHHTSHLVNNIPDLSLSQWIDLKTLIYFQKIVCTREPSYLFQKLLPAQSQGAQSFIIPRYKTLCLRRQIFINAIRLWNNLPHALKTIRSAPRFYCSTNCL